MPASTPPSATAATASSAKSTPNTPPRATARWREVLLRPSPLQPHGAPLARLEPWGCDRCRLPSFETPRLGAAPQDEDLALFDVFVFLAAGFAFFGRLRNAARCAAARAALAQTVSSSGSS